MKYVSLFAGIGGFDLALNRLGHECVYANDFDKYCKQVYDRHFELPLDTASITDVDEQTIPDHDLLVGGFPCQAFSIAGKRRGFDEARGTLFFDIARILKHKRPARLLLENVKGLLSHDMGRTFVVILRTLDELGYDVQWQVCNSKDFGVPQNRERIFVAGYLRGTPRSQVFPLAPTDSATTFSNTIRSGGQRSLTAKHAWDLIQVNNPTHANNRVYDPSGIGPTLNTMQGGNRQPKIINPLKGKTEYGWHFEQNVYSPEGHVRTLKSTEGSGNKPKVVEGATIRRLTPIECERLQGFPDNWTAEGTAGAISNTQRYKMLGNAVTVNVVQAIASKLGEM